MTYQEEFARQEQENKQAAENNRVSEQVYLLFTARRDLRPIEANKKLLVQYFGETRELTLETLLLAVEHEGLKKQLAWYKSNEDLRAKLTARISALLAGSDQSKQHVLNSLKYLDTPALQEKLDELERRVVARAQTTGELHAQLRATDIRVQPVPTEFTKQALIKMAPEAMRRLIRAHGLQAVNDRIQGRN